MFISNINFFHPILTNFQELSNLIPNSSHANQKSFLKICEKRQPRFQLLNMINALKIIGKKFCFSSLLRCSLVVSSTKNINDNNLFKLWVFGMKKKELNLFIYKTKASLFFFLLSITFFPNCFYGNISSRSQS